MKVNTPNGIKLFETSHVATNVELVYSPGECMGINLVSINNGIKNLVLVAIGIVIHVLNVSR